MPFSEKHRAYMRVFKCRIVTDFGDTKQIFLEQNYRSTAAILRASLAIVAEG